MTSGTRLPRSNPVGCWDWWGYDDANYANKNGRQMAAVRAMLARLAGDSIPPDEEPAGFCGSATNADHVAAGRAYTFFFLYFAQGSNEFLGFGALTQKTLKEISPGRFEQVASCP